MFNFRFPQKFFIIPSAALLFIIAFLAALLLTSDEKCEENLIIVDKQRLHEIRNYSAAASNNIKEQISKDDELVPWSDYVINDTFVVKYCRHNLDMKKWAPKFFNLQPVICYAPGDRFISAFITEDGNWEIKQQEKLFRDVFPKFPNAAFLDIGANIGVFAISAGFLGRKVFAFEPMPETLKSLSHSLALNKLLDKVDLYPYGIMDKRSCVYSQLFHIETNKGTGSFL